jgi:SAM-dependent methyltransferase
MAYPTARNKGPILEVLRRCLGILGKEENHVVNILEVASGTGEHCAYFASNLPNIRIQPTEPQKSELASILKWTDNLPNVFPPIISDVAQLLAASDRLPDCMQAGQVDMVICVNMIHISPLTSTYDLFRSSSNLLKTDGLALLYGPYRVNGTMVESNVAFDENLKSRNPEWGIRDLEEVEAIARSEGGFSLHSTVEMPANNLCVIFQKQN